MDNNNVIEKRLEKIESLLLGQKDVFTFEECCQYTGISKTYMYKLTCTNRIPHFKPHGKIIYFSKEEIRPLVDEKSGKDKGTGRAGSGELSGNRTTQKIICKL